MLLALSRAAGSSISVTDVPLREIVAKSQLTVLAKVERIDSTPYPNAKVDEPELRFCQLRIEEVLKPKGGSPPVAKGSTIHAFDPRDKYQHDQYESIRAGVISFAEQRYATKADTMAEGDHLIFFLHEQPTIEGFPLEHASVFAAGQAYDLATLKPTVLQLVH